MPPRPRRRNLTHKPHGSVGRLVLAWFENQRCMTAGRILFRCAKIIHCGAFGVSLASSVMDRHYRAVYLSFYPISNKNLFLS